MATGTAAGVEYGPRFALGRVVATPGAMELIESKALDSWALLKRHARGDWGDVDEGDSALNDAALRTGERVLSAYEVSEGVRVWVITEADRSATTFLLPEEY